MFTFKISSSIRYGNFGYIPSGYFLRDLYGWLFGINNLIKRLQARDLINALDPDAQQTILDIGCGKGHFTVEIAKKSKRTVGADIAEGTKMIHVPKSLTNRLEFIQVAGVSLPFETNTFDKVFANAVIGTVENEVEFLQEWHRVLKPGGKLVIVNASGRAPIERAYLNQGWLFRTLRKKYPKRFPGSYADFEVIMNDNFGNQRKKFPQPGEFSGTLANCGFEKTEIRKTLSMMTGNLLSWYQFISYLRKGRISSLPGWPPHYYFFRTLELFSRVKCDFCHIYISENAE